MPKSGWWMDASATARSPSRRTLTFCGRSRPRLASTPSRRASAGPARAGRSARNSIQGCLRASSTSRAMVASISRRSRSDRAPGASWPPTLAQTTRKDAGSNRPRLPSGWMATSKRSTRSLRSCPTPARSPALFVKTRHSAVDASKRVAFIASRERRSSGGDDPREQGPAPEHAEPDGEEARRCRQGAGCTGSTPEMGERPSDQTGERGHAEDRSESEERHVREPGPAARQARQGDRGERSAAGEAVHDPDDQRPARERPATEMNVPGSRLVLVMRSAVRVHLPRPSSSFVGGAGQGTGAEREQHQRDAELEGVGQPRRQTGAQERQGDCDSEQCGGVAEAPGHSEQETLAPTALFDDQRRDGGEVIGFTGVPHPEQDTEQRSGNGFHRGPVVARAKPAFHRSGSSNVSVNGVVLRRGICSARVRLAERGVVMSHAALWALLAGALIGSASGQAAAASTRKYVVLANGERIGTLHAVTSGNSVDIDWRIDDNGRGPKMKERIRLGPTGVPAGWEVEGVGWIGAPVKESFSFESGTAHWKTLDDEGEAGDEKAPLYLPNNGSPWSLALDVRAAIASPDHRRKVLPAGEIRAEKIRQVRIGEGENASTFTAWALWGLDVLPNYVLTGRNIAFEGYLSPGFVVIDERFASQYDALSRLAPEMSAGSLRKFTANVSHRYPGPVYLTHVRVFDPATGAIGEPTTVTVFSDEIVSVRPEAPPRGAIAIDGQGGTLLPGLHDVHAHSYDWGGPLHVAAGVTRTRDPGNDNDVLLTLTARIDSGEVLGPRIHRAGFLEGRSPFSSHGGFVVDRLDVALETVGWYADHGFSGIKIYNSINPDWVKPIAAEAHRLGLRVSGHVPAFMTSERAVRDGYDEITHVNQLMLSFVIGDKDA